MKIKMHKFEFFYCVVDIKEHLLSIENNYRLNNVHELLFLENKSCDITKF